ncbi:hypothetical protein B0T24DRAFT_609157 [Lasiosphaeria ovina]|uniref:Uncharacterized protein n=1 Tax=Lasiosphaeria ovina TaxID=92902 RepID=A0AAE0NN82_9PEZI|nr:hypothetical protein B0T24DRAFT_609157 [Lasiosphaeria ovina]
MDILRQFADMEVDKMGHCFREAGSGPNIYTVLEASGEDSNHFRIREQSIRATDLKEWATKPGTLSANSTSMGGGFRLLEIKKDSGMSFDIEKENFDMVLNAFGIEPTLKLTDFTMGTGFFPSIDKSRIPSNSYQPLHSFLLIVCSEMNMFWSYEPRTCSTRVILFAKQLFMGYLHNSFIAAKRCFIHPLFPGLIALAAGHLSLNSTLTDDLKAVLSIEKITGTRLDIEEQTDNPSEDLYITLTKEAGRRSTSAANIGAMIRVIDDFTLALVSNSLGLKGIEVTRDRQEQFDEAWDEMAAAASLLQLHAQNMALNVAVIEKRVSLQMNILYNLIAKSDAGASISLAKAAKDDSSSMKTVAVVTMAFLPATFFAAVFAMPLLKWDASPVVQDNFWVYLAFALPSTALVFTIWVIITQRETIKKLLQTGILARLRKRQRGTEDGDMSEKDESTA